MSEAPKDGTRLMLYRHGRIVCGRWDDDRYANVPTPYWTHDHIIIYGKKDARTTPPTHWMPLPEPPDAD